MAKAEDPEVEMESVNIKERQKEKIKKNYILSTKRNEKKRVVAVGIDNSSRSKRQSLVFVLVLVFGRM